jgi:hypothetical protein
VSSQRQKLPAFEYALDVSDLPAPSGHNTIMNAVRSVAAAAYSPIAAVVGQRRSLGPLRPPQCNTVVIPEVQRP